MPDGWSAHRRPSHDVIIVGASVAGAATAYWLGRAGVCVLLVDRAQFPRDKPCGEGIMPAGVDVLARMNLLATLIEHGAHPFDGIMFRDHHGCCASGSFAEAGQRPGLICRRRQLDATILSEAANQPSVEVLIGFRVTRILRQGSRVIGIAGCPRQGDPSREQRFTAPITVGADGLHSIFHRSGLVNARRPRRQRYGVRAHLEGVEGLGSHVEVITDAHGEVYMAAHGRSTAMIALLLEREAMNRFARGLTAAYWESLQSIASLRQRIGAARLITPVMATGPLGSRVDRIVGDGFLLIGDSAGALDPITGAGLSLALRSAPIAARVITEALSAADVSAARLRAYEVAWRAMFDPLARLTRLVLELARHPSLAHWTINRLRCHPNVMHALLARASGSSVCNRLDATTRAIGDPLETRTAWRCR